MTEKNLPPQYESDTVDSKSLIRWVVILVVLLVGSIVVCVALFKSFQYFFAEGREPSRLSAGKIDVFPLPRLQANPPEDLIALRAKEKTQLESYRWVDKQAGIAQIPIRQAMQLIVERSEKSGASK